MTEKAVGERQEVPKRMAFLCAAHFKEETDTKLKRRNCFAAELSGVLNSQPSERRISMFVWFCWKIVEYEFKAPALPELDDESRIERRHWGEIGSDEDSSEESEEEEEGEGAETGFITPATTEG